MFVDIKDPVYSTLNTHVVLGGSGRIIPATTTITNGFYSSLPTTYTELLYIQTIIILLRQI